MKKLLISSFIGSENTGDEAIFFSICVKVQKLLARISVFSINPEKTCKLLSGLGKIEVIPMRSFIKTVSAICNTDIFICGGGGFLQDQTSIWNVLRHLYKVAVAKFFKKQIIFYSVGAGPVNFFLNKWLIKTVASWAELISVRDNDSRVVLSDIGIPHGKITVTADPAINFSPCEEEHVREILKEEKVPQNKPLIAVCLRDWFDTFLLLPVGIMKKFSLRSPSGRKKYHYFISEIARLIRTILEKNDVNILFIPFWPGRDSKVHQDVISNIEDKRKIYQITKSYSPREILGLIKVTELVIGMRLHSLILACNAGVPIVGIVYSQKVASFMKEINQSKSTVDIESISFGFMSHLFETVWENKDRIKSELIKERNKLKERESLNITMLAQLMEK